MTSDEKYICNILKNQNINLGLENINNVLIKLGIPCQEIPAIQIAGTNGKGSIISFLQSCLKLSKIKTGITTSPHLISWCERISIGEEMISLEDFKWHLNKIKPIAKSYNLTTFETVFATALDYFNSKDIELILLEVGLGGRLDATTIHSLRPIIAIASIGLDHCEYLGESLNDIAKEKAAIITPNSFVISAKQHIEVEKVLIDTASKNNAKLKIVEPLKNDWELGLDGNFQKQNAAVAKTVLETLITLGWNITDKDIRKGLAEANWRGRMQKVFWKDKPLLIDGAHNPHASKQLAIERKKWQNNELGVHWILAIQKNKNAPEIIRYLIKTNDVIWITSVPGQKSWVANEIINHFPSLSKNFIEVNDVEHALNKISSYEKWPNPPPIIAGSLYLIGDIFKREIITEQSKS